ncbi:hypothetical protein IW15_22675 [Chryseobacterium soli]|uniref:Sugar-binding protein n=2 Tax=Chryseobacterium soli TaxID=445961 RepID=A0A085ZWU8_9FLAO|nr:hypothetical protein IW15_22675 [Chryseobacterium soli]
MPITYPTSPDVTKMQTYGQIPVTSYSGLANISVPIYTIKEGSFEFPITLDYSTRGIKVREEATRVGLGWNLGFPGLISRNVNGKPDYDAVYNYTNRYFAAKAKNNTLIPDFTGYVAPIDFIKLGLETKIMPTNYKMENYIQGDRYFSNNPDFMPDDYYYTLPKYSGKFIFKRDRTPILEKIQDKLKIEITDSLGVQGQPTLKKLKIIDPLGTAYTFNDFETVFSQDHEGSVATNVTINNAWYISKIKTKEGNEIKFTYDLIETIPSYNLYDYSGIPMNFFNDGNNGTTPVGTFPYYQDKMYEGWKEFKCKLIKKIEFSEGVIEFDYDTRQDLYGDKRIVAISLKNKQNKLIKKIKLNQSYFDKNFNSMLTELGAWQQSAATSNFMNRQDILNKRLKLNSIEYQDANEQTINTEGFEYYDQYIPAKNSTAIDYWGYFNGEPQNEHLFTSFTLTVPEVYGDYFFIAKTGNQHIVTIPGANRQINPLFTNSMSLKKIIYPTKGGTEFEYENNTYDPEKSFVSDANAGKYSLYQNNNINGNKFNLAGGQRIKSLINTDNSGGIYKKNYIYHSTRDDNNDGIMENYSSGYLLNRPNFFYFRPKTTINAGNGEGTVNTVNGYILLKNSPTYDNDFIGYETIDEIATNLTDNTKIKSTYTYNITPPTTYSGIYDLMKGFQAPTPDFSEPQNMFVKSLVRYNIFRLDFEYKTDPNNPPKEYYRDYAFDYRPDFIKNDIEMKNGLLKSLTQYSFNNNSYTPVTSEEYEYNWTNYFLPQYWGVYYDFSSAVIPPSDMFIIPQEYQFYNNYTAFYNASNTTTVQTSGYLGSNQYNIVYKSIVPIYNPGASSITKKEYFNGKIITTKTDNEYPMAMQGQYSPNWGNLLSQKITFPDNTIKESTYKYSFDKNNQKLLSANMIDIPLETTITNKQNTSDTGKIISKTETKYDNPVNIFPTSVLTYNTLAGSMDTEVTFDKYDLNGNIQQYTAKNGVSTTVIWGYNNTQPIAKIEGAKIYDIPQALIDSIVNASNTDAISGTDASEQSLIAALDAFRNNAGLSAFQISTYTYDPLIGVRSITPPSGIREVYKYDSANRLEKVVDANGKVLKEYQYHYKN